MGHPKLESHVFSVLKDKIQLIKNNGSAIYLVGPLQLPVNLYGETNIYQRYCWLNYNELKADYEKIIDNLPSANLAEDQQSSVLVYVNFKTEDDSVIRLQSILHTVEIFGSKRCDCGFQLKGSMKKIKQHGAAALFYFPNHAGRGMGLFSKAMAYVLQENGSDT